MDYHLNRDGQNLGIFPLEELRRRRESGELNGTEYVWHPGMANWQRIDTALDPEAASSAGSSAPPAPRKSNKLLITLVVAGLLIFVGGIVAVGFAAREFVRGFQTAVQTATQANSTRAGGQLSLKPGTGTPSNPIVVSTNTISDKEVQAAGRDFRIRQYLDGYKQNSERNPDNDEMALQLIQSWLHEYYGGFDDLKLPPAAELSDKLAADPNCRDPLLQLVTALKCNELNEAIRRYERALSGFEKSRHLGYVQFYANGVLATKLSDPGRVAVLEAAAVEALKKALKDGSIQERDHPLLAEMMVSGWATGLFKRHASTICPYLETQGKSYQWLALMLKGEYHIQRAWNERGGGYADSVSTKGWQGFSKHLAAAREQLTRAWELHPERALAPARMVYVAMAETGLEDMRVWFARTTAAQIDQNDAWSSMRWGLRPRWHGDLNAMHDFGLSALATGRFDTDVPRRYFDTLMDMESEMELAPGRRIFGDPHIWPNLQKMYDGYIAQHAGSEDQNGWRQTYAIVAFLAQKYDVARVQLEALNWDDCAACRGNWGAELSLMTLETAARTGEHALDVQKAEQSRERGGLAEALAIYLKLAKSADDARTKQFAEHRVASLELEQHLAKGEWVDFMPKEPADLNWIVLRGEHRILPDGTLEVTSGKTGHLLFSRARVGDNLEVRGEFEVVSSSTKAFQAGLVFGLPDFDAAHWYGFRVKRNLTENEVVSFATQWSKQQVYKPMMLNDVTNSFHVRLQAGNVSAWVNGSTAFSGVKPVKSIMVFPQGFHVGVGAFNDMNNTVIRYRNLQVRRIHPYQEVSEN